MYQNSVQKSLRTRLNDVKSLIKPIFLKENLGPLLCFQVDHKKKKFVVTCTVQYTYPIWTCRSHPIINKLIIIAIEKLCEEFGKDYIIINDGGEADIQINGVLSPISSVKVVSRKIMSGCILKLNEATFALLKGQCSHFKSKFSQLFADAGETSHNETDVVKCLQYMIENHEKYFHHTLPQEKSFYFPGLAPLQIDFLNSLISYVQLVTQSKFGSAGFETIQSLQNYLNDFNVNNTRRRGRKWLENFKKSPGVILQVIQKYPRFDLGKLNLKSIEGLLDHCNSPGWVTKLKNLKEIKLDASIIDELDQYNLDFCIERSRREVEDLYQAYRNSKAELLKISFSKLKELMGLELILGVFSK